MMTSLPETGPRTQQGVALIMVLLAMALVVMLASGMTQQQNIRVFKAGHYLAQQQGQSIALGAEAFARQILINDFEDDKENGQMIDSRSEERRVGKECRYRWWTYQ